MFLKKQFQRISDFISFWYMRYLLVTELYIVEPWERAVMHIIILIFLMFLSYINILLMHNLNTILRLIYVSLNTLNGQIERIVSSLL